MTQELYATLTAKEKLMYDELSGFSQRMAARLEEVQELLKTLIAMVQEVENE